MSSVVPPGFAQAKALHRKILTTFLRAVLEAHTQDLFFSAGYFSWSMLYRVFNRSRMRGTCYGTVSRFLRRLGWSPFDA